MAATHILLNTITVGTNKVHAGSGVDSVLEARQYADLQAAGGQFEALPNALIEATALIARRSDRLAETAVQAP